LIIDCSKQILHRIKHDQQNVVQIWHSFPLSGSHDISRYNYCCAAQKFWVRCRCWKYHHTYTKRSSRTRSPFENQHRSIPSNYQIWHINRKHFRWSQISIYRPVAEPMEYHRRLEPCSFGSLKHLNNWYGQQFFHSHEQLTVNKLR
jgi:hypothetical protein